VDFDCSTYRERLEELAAELPTTPRTNLPAFFAAATELSGSLPLNMRRVLADFRAHGNDDGYVRLRGLPINPDNLPDTPEHWRASVDRQLLGMEPWITLIGMRMGVATGYKENREGAVFQDVFPARDRKAMTATQHSMSAHGHQAMLRWHTEMAYLATQPNFLVIGCARADHDRMARTPIVSVRQILRKLNDEHREVLRTVPLPWHVDAAFQSSSDPDPMTDLLLLTGGDDILRYDGGLIIPSEVERSCGKLAREALEAFTETANAIGSGVHLEPGDILLLDNNRTAHGRTQFTPRFDGKDRWLNRIFVRTLGSDHAAKLEHAQIVPFQLRTSERVLT
jgi:clavaminate synthase